MTFFPEPLKPPEGNKDNPIRVNPIEEDKKGTENSIVYQPVTDEPDAFLVTSAILLFMKNFISLLDLAKKTPTTEFVIDEPLRDIYVFYSLLEHLKQSDLSRDPAFCRQLSETWNRLLQHRMLMHRIQKKPKINITTFDALIKAINTFPSSEDQKLGYYLSEQAGKEWLPTPFMDLLYRLYDDYHINRHQSHLEKWTQLIFSMAPNLKPQLPH
ncbi:MAG: hypothetical protein AAF443_02280 [Chlamydiota bacterium]